MNNGLKGGHDHVSSPKAADNFNSPTSPFNFRITPVATTLNSWDWAITTHSISVNTPLNPVLGDQFVVQVSAGSLTIAASPGQTINGKASVSASPVGALVKFTYAQANAWTIESIFGTDATAINWQFSAPVTLASGSNTASAANVTTPTLGAAAQLAQTAADSMLYIVIGTAGTALTIAIGPTSGVADVLVNGVAATSGCMYTVRLPAGWFVKVTATTATWTTTAIVC